MATNQLTGFSNKFIDSECLKEFECPLCLHVTREPSLTGCCGQHFCSACINRVLSGYFMTTCPLCKEDSFTTMLDKKQNRRVLDLKVYCDKKDVGCDWTGILGEFEKHLEKSCSFVLVDCPNNCGVTIQRGNLADHRANHCPKRPHSCEYCQLKGTYHNIQEDHLLVCPKYPVPCPHECSVAPLERDQLEHHMAKCPLAVVECELREVGCEEKVQRKDLDRHMEEAARKHLQLMTTFCITIAGNQAALKNTVTMIQKENCALKNELAQTTKKLTTTQREVVEQKRELDLLRLNLPSMSSISKVILSMKTTFVQIHLKNYSVLKINEGRWENPEEFYTFPSRHRMKINLYFNSPSNQIEVELTHLKLKDDEDFTWPKEFQIVVRLINQNENSGHFEIAKTLSVEHNDFNDNIFIKYSKIQSGGGKYLLNDSVRLQAHVSEV